LELDAFGLGQGDQLLVAPSCQFGIRGVGNRFGHDGGIDHCHLEALRGNRPSVLSEGHTHFQQLASPVFTNAMAKPHHGGLIHREPMLEDHFTAKVLPVRVLHPAIQNIPV
jgi:hypothetical protein